MATVEQTAEITALIEKQNKLYAAQGQMIKSQINMAQQLQVLMQGIGFEEKTRGADEFRNVLNAAADQIEDYASTTQGSMDKITRSLLGASSGGDKLEKTLTEVSKKAKGIGVLAVALDGLKEGFDFSVNAARSFIGVLGTMAGSITDIAFSVITFPFKILQGLINMTEGGGGSGLRQALEDIRKEFGDLRTGASAAIIDISRSMKGQLAETGLSTWRIFGNLAKRLKTITEYATAMGNAFDLVRDSFVQNAERVGAYIKGLGLSEEGQKAFAETAIKSGRTLQEVGREVTTYAYQMGDAFGINGKSISRDVGNMMADVSNFGNLSVQTLTNVSVFARRLGVDFKALLGVVDQFDNFENAANSAAQLSQAFGLQLDTLQLLNAQDPADRIEMLRKSFFAAGKSIENMTRQERALLASQTGLEQGTLAMVFSLESQSKSYADIQKSSEATKKKQLSQAEAMEKLAGSIERLVESGSSGSGGFFDRFIQGFSKGIRRSREFREIMIHLRRSLMVVHLAGIQVGRAFVDAFPGIKEMLGAIGDFFKPARFRNKMQSVISAFKNLFAGNIGLEEFYAKLKANFADFFDPNSSIAQRFMSGVKAFFKKAKTLFIEGLKLGMEGLKQGFDFIRELIANPEAAMSSASGSSNAMLAFFFQEIINPLVAAIKGPAGQELWDSLQSLFMTVVSRLGDYLGEVLAKHQLKIAGALVAFFAGPAIVTSLVRGLVGTLGFALAKGLSGAASKGLAGARALLASSSQAGSALSGAGQGLTKSQGSAVTQSVSSAGNLADAINRVRIGPAIAKMAALSLFMGALATGLAVALVQLVQYIKRNRISTSDVGNAVLFMGGAVTIAGAIGLLVAGLTAVGAGLTGPGALAAIAGAAAVALTGVGLVVGMTKLVSAVNRGPSPEEVRRAAEFVGMGALIVTALGATTVALALVGGVSALAGPLAFLGGVVLYKGMTGIVKLVTKAVKEFSNVSVSNVLAVAKGVTASAAIIAAVGAIGAELALIGGFAPVGTVAALFGGVALAGVLKGVPALISMAISAFGSIDKRQIKKTAVLITAVSDILRGIASVATTLTRIGINGVVDSLMSAFGAGSSMSAVSVVLTNMRTSIAQVIATANSITITDAEQEKLRGVSAALGILNEFSTTLKNVSDTITPGLAETVFNVDAMTKRTVALTTVMGGMSGSIGAFVNIVLGTVSRASPDDLAKIQPVASLIETLGGLIGSMSSVAERIPTADPDEFAANMTRMGRFMDTVVSQMRNTFIGVTKGLLDVISNDAFEPTKFKAAADSFATVFGALTSLSTALSQSASGGGDTGGGTAAKLRSLVTGASELFTGGGFTGQLGEVINSMASLAGSFDAAKLTKIGLVGESVTSISSALATVSRELTSVNDVSIQRVETGVTALVQSINNIGDSISQIRGVDLNGELRALANRLGLEGRDTLRINHGDYNLTVNLKVTVDTEEFEKALLRPGTKIHFDRGQ